MVFRDLDDPALLDQVFDATYPLWGDGLSREAYAKWNLAQGRTRWGRERLQRVGLIEADTVVASAKRYLFDVTVNGAPMLALGIGAVFTPEDRRGHGLAARLIEAMVDDGRQRGCGVAVLFSEIGAAYYERLGFTVVPRTLVPVDVPRSRRGAPGTMVRSLEPADLPGLADIAAKHEAASDFALRRTADLIEFSLTRHRLRAGLGPAGLRQLEVFVSEEGHKPVSFVVISRGPSGVVLEDCGDRDPAGARIGAMLEALAEREPSHPDRTLRAWLPQGIQPPQLQLGSPFPAAEVMMIRSIITSSPRHPATSPYPYWPQLDVF